MCGIIFGANIQQDKKTPAQPVNQWIGGQFEDQFSRGTQGFGLVFIKANGEHQIERACEPYKALMDLRDKKNQSPIILMHHRTPTSSQNKMQETHPILVDNGSLKYKYLGVHNGVISNNDELRKTHEALGFAYTTVRTNDRNQEEFNDSECLIIELARYAEKQITKLNITRGGSFILLQIDKKTDKVERIFYGRTDGSFPLKMAKDRKKIIISSEGEGNDVATEMLYSFGLDDFKIEKTKLAKEEKMEESFSLGSYYRGQGSFVSELGRGKMITEINKQKSEDDDVPAGQQTIEDMIQEIYDKAEETNDAIMTNLDLFTIQRDLTEQIEDEQKIMQIDAKQIALEVTMKVYNAIKECQANFLEAMLKEEKLCSIASQSKTKGGDLEPNEVNLLAASQNEGDEDEKDILTGIRADELSGEEEIDAYRQSQLINY